MDALLLTEQLSAQIMDQAMAMTFWAGVVTLIIYWIRFAVRFKVIVSVVVTYFPWPQASLVFGLMHGTIIWVLYAFVLGMVMTWIFERYQSLTANIIFHLAFNAMGLVLSAIPESMEFIVWIFFVAGIVGAVVAVKQILKITVMEDKKEETVEEKVCEA